MKRLPLIRMATLGFAALMLAATGCRRGSEEVTRKLGFEEFVPVYNRYMKAWIAQQKEVTAKDLANALILIGFEAQFGKGLLSGWVSRGGRHRVDVHRTLPLVSSEATTESKNVRPSMDGPVRLSTACSG